MSATIAGFLRNTATKNHSELAQKIVRLAKWPIDTYVDCCSGVTGIGMLVEEAHERATKPWYQRLSED